MENSAKEPFRSFIILTYLLFWLLFLITGGTVYLNAPVLVQKIMMNICAWTSTFVLLIRFRLLFPGSTIKEFLKKQFTRVNFFDFLIPFLIQVLIVFCATAAFFRFSGESLRTAETIKLTAVVPALLLNITSGPTGEELGWRAYVLNYLQKKNSPLVSSLIVGVLWGFWHFPLWLVAGYSGMGLLLYSLYFMLGILGFSVFITFFYNRTQNILVAVWIHFLFNMLLQIVVVEDYIILLYVSVLYLIVSAVIVLLNRREMLTVNQRIKLKG